MRQTDRHTDVRQHHLLMSPPSGRGHNKQKCCRQVRFQAQNTRECVCSRDFAPDSLGELNSAPQTPSWFLEGRFVAGEGRENREGTGWEGERERKGEGRGGGGQRSPLLFLFLTTGHYHHFHQLSQQKNQELVDLLVAVG